MLAALTIAMEEGIVTKPYRADACKCWHLTAHRGGRDRQGKTIQKIREFTKEREEDGREEGP